MEMMKFPVIKSEGAMVRPCKPTPSERLPLSTIDQLPALRRKVQTLHVFRHGDANAAEMIKLGLSKALVHYYPLAGRLFEDDGGLLQVNCTGEGVWFMQASADRRLDALQYLDGHPTDTHFELLAGPPPASTCSAAAATAAASGDKDVDNDQNAFDNHDPLVLIQVTSFACNGFTVGVEFSHCVCDGLGAAQFLNAVAELARGLPLPSLSPAWARDALVVGVLPTAQKAEQQAESRLLPRPPETATAMESSLYHHQLERTTVDVSLDQVAHLKQEFFGRTGRTCSAFEAITAAIWRSRTRAINFDSQAEMRLVFFTNARPMVVPPLPRGFYGNCFFPVNVTAPAGRLLEGSVVDVVELIQEAKARVGSEWAEWMAGGVASRPFDPPLTYNALFVSEWSRLGFGSIDYGWGPPVHIMPIQYSNVIPGCILCSPPPPKTGLRLMTWCVQALHVPNFSRELMTSFF